jgi:bifunctional UDP-N-acetylglucosamine pyrophosphorylase/glucosamine-1-phosphate N-acetyltransferase
VIITGSDEWPVVVGDGVTVKGTTYIFGSTIDPGVDILHSVLIKKRIERVERRDGTVQPVRFFLPLAEGVDSITSLEELAEGPSPKDPPSARTSRSVKKTARRSSRTARRKRR